MEKFDELALEKTFIELLSKKGFKHLNGNTLSRSNDEIILENELRKFLLKRYKSEELEDAEVGLIFNKLNNLSSSKLYESNKVFSEWLSDGFNFKRLDSKKKDIWINLIDFDDINLNDFKFVTQLTIMGSENRRPDGIIFVNGLPIVVFEFKSAIRENATIFDAFVQINTRYIRDIPDLFKFNMFCVISDGINSKSGTCFADYDYFYPWRRTLDNKNEMDGIDSMFSLIDGMFEKLSFIEIIKNFIYIPDKSSTEEKILCRYPQFYATRSIFESIKERQRPLGDGKGGTYFGSTGCGKSFIMLFLTRMLMKSEHFENPTVVLITDRTQLDSQLSKQFLKAKKYIGDAYIKSAKSRNHLREMLNKRKSGGVFLTTIHKFTEDIKLLSDRSNIICISDEAHRSQINLEQKIHLTSSEAIKKFSFAKYLRDSLPSATYVGFTGTPIDATIDAFGEIIDEYTMSESVADKITVPIVYEGRAAKVLGDKHKLLEIDKYYEELASSGTNIYQIEKSKKDSSNINKILGDPDRLKDIAIDFVSHYENRVEEGGTVLGKAIFVCNSRELAYDFYKNLIDLRPGWNKKEKIYSSKQLKSSKTKSIEKIKLVMTRHKDDKEEMYEIIGNDKYQDDLELAFKDEESNLKIAIVVDKWLTGFDLPCLDSIYIDKPIKEHNLIQAISRVNRNYPNKEKGLVIDYIGIKNQMHSAYKEYNKGKKKKLEDLEFSRDIVIDQLDLLDNIFHKFDESKYFHGTSLEKLITLKEAAEYIQNKQDTENRFMKIVKILKSAYDICSGGGDFSELQKNQIHFYFAIRSLVFKLNISDTPDLTKMNKKVSEMIEKALIGDGVEEIIFNKEKSSEIDIFNDSYISNINKIKLPNTKIKLLKRLLNEGINSLKKINKVAGFKFSKKFENLVEKYNQRNEENIFKTKIYDEISNELTDMIIEVRNEFSAGDNYGLKIEEKAFFDILQSQCRKHNFSFSDENIKELSREIKNMIGEQTNFPDAFNRQDIKSSIKVELIILLDKYGYPPIERDEICKEIYEQAESFNVVELGKV